MRFIDDMIKSIPLEEMTGGTNMNNNEIETKGIIPDEPVSNESESKTESYVNEKPVEKSAVQTTAIKAAKPARVKSKGLGVLAAALAVVIGTGGVLTYLGAAKNTGPLASVFSSEDGGSSASEETKLLAMGNAKTVFTTVNGCVTDMIAEGKVKDIKTGLFKIDFAELSNGDKDYEQELRSDAAEGGMMAYYAAEIDQTIAEALSNKDLGLRGGELAFYIDDQYRLRWAHWRSANGSYVGQYPNPQDGVEFGKFTEGSPDAVPSEDTDNSVKIDLNDKDSVAKYVFVQISSSIADMTAEGKVDTIPEGKNEMKLSENRDSDGEFFMLIRGGLEAANVSGEIAFSINPNKQLNWAQWRAGDGEPVGQYPQPTEGLTFGMSNIVTDDYTHVVDPSNENAVAKLMYTAASAACADLAFGQEEGEIPTGTVKLSIPALKDEQGYFCQILAEACASYNINEGEIAMYIDPTEYKPLWTQWRSAEGQPVGQYPASDKELEFGISEFTPESAADAVKVETVVYMTGFDGVTTELNHSELETDKTVIANIISSIDNAARVAADDSTPQLYGPGFAVKFSDEATGKAYTVQSSDRSYASLIVNGEYIDPENDDLKAWFDKLYYEKASAAWAFITDKDTGSINGYGMDDDSYAKAQDWYSSFSKSGISPVTAGNWTEKPDAELNGIRFRYNGNELITISTTKFEEANLQINGSYYMVEDTTIIDLINALG